MDKTQRKNNSTESAISKNIIKEFEAFNKVLIVSASLWFSSAFASLLVFIA